VHALVTIFFLMQISNKLSKMYMYLTHKYD